MNIIRCKGRSFGVVLLVAGLTLALGRPLAATSFGAGELPSITQGQEELPSISQGQAELAAAAPSQEALPAAAVAGDKDAVSWDMPVFSPPGRFRLRTDYLVWWTSGMNLPPLVTTSPQGTLPEQAGLWSGTNALFGDQTVNSEGRSGYRTTLGMWLDAAHVWDLEIDYLSLTEQKTGFSQASDGNPILARPFYNVQTGQQASQLVAYPGVVTGAIRVDTQDLFQSAGALVGYQLLSNASGGPGQDSNGRVFGSPLLYGNRTDFLAGFRYYNLRDRVGIVDNRQFPTGETLAIHDNFSANNDFYGGELGFRTHLYRGRWSLEMLTKVALGGTRRSSNVYGQTDATVPNPPATAHYELGTLAVGTNSGPHHSDDFSVIPQLGLELGYQVTRNWRAYCGYNVVYWGNVWRAGDQIDLNVDPRNFPPPPALPGARPFPAFPGTTSAFWAQGVNLGAEFRF